MQRRVADFEQKLIWNGQLGLKSEAVWKCDYSNAQ